ncbi:MAG: prepilin peptidase [Rhodospirillales bacterium]|nr:MAG: prepilin peptidase [Rhodospirillales bacterium]
MELLPSLLAYLVFALYGLATGSLAGALSYRLPRRQPVIFDRSRCPSCNATLSAVDLIPVFTWLFTKGRCRHCGAKVSARYPLIELTVTGLFLLSLALAPNLWAAVCLAFLGAGLVVLVVADLEMRLLPDPIQLGLALLAVGWRAATGGDWAQMLIGGVAGLGTALLLRWGFFLIRKRQGLGLGDVKFLGVAGLWLGLDGLPLFCFTAGVLGVLFGLAWRALGHGKVFPFGPSLAVSLFLALFLLPAIR